MLKLSEEGSDIYLLDEKIRRPIWILFTVVKLNLVNYRSLLMLELLS